MQEWRKKEILKQGLVQQIRMQQQRRKIVIKIKKKVENEKFIINVLAFLLNNKSNLINRKIEKTV